MDADLDSLTTALYVILDDLLKSHPEVCPQRPAAGIAPKISDAEVITLTVVAQLLGHTNERRWIRWAKAHLTGMFPRLPNQAGYNKRVRGLAGAIIWCQRVLAMWTAQWHDDTWLVDSTPVECGRSVDTRRRSDLAGWAETGYCASHSRYFWGLRLHIVATLGGLPVAWALAGAKQPERALLVEMLGSGIWRPGQALLADKGYASGELEAMLARSGITMLRPARTNEPPRPGSHLFKPFRQVIESINSTLKTHLDIEHHRGRTKPGVVARIGAAMLALTAVIWHNELIGAPIARSLIAYDH
jgi:hypothetical protein